MGDEAYFIVNGEFNFHLTQFLVATKHTGWCKMIS